VVEKISHVGFEVVGIEHPSAVGDVDTELMFLVAFARQRAESETLLLGVVDKGGTRNSFNRRRLIVVSVECAERPMQARHGDGCAEARLYGGLVDWWSGRRSGKIPLRESRGAHAGGERHPGKRIEFFVNVEGFEIRRGMLAVADRRKSAAIVENRAKALVVALIETDDPNLKIVLLVIRGDVGLTSNIS
jgi:hypothetical protein